MKKTFFYTALVILVSGSIFTSCDSKAEKVDDAKEEVTDAKQDLNEAQQELNAEYPPFKIEAEARIAENERRIAILKAELARPGKAPLDGLRKKKIDELEAKNAH